MNGEIKYRVWDKKQKKYWYSPDLNDFDAARRWFAMLEDMDYGEGFEQLQQSTGLKDKNGKEIYGGDLVSGYAPDSEVDESFKIMVVVWSEDSLILARPNPSRSYFHDLSSCVHNKSIEIIGNIYENPDLLKENI